MHTERLGPLSKMFLLGMAIGSAVSLPIGCGGTKKEGTQAEMPDDALEDAKRSSDFYDQQPKGKKK